MIVHVHAVCWNERDRLPYFLRHYEQLASRIFIYDNESDDGSREVAARHPKCRVETFTTYGRTNELMMTTIRNQRWKRSRHIADWVIVCDIDELLWHKNLMHMLLRRRQAGNSLLIPQGYQMVSETFPATERQIYETVSMGVADSLFSKPVCFAPHLIDEINFAPGSHRCDPIGTVCRASVYLRDADLKLLHFKYLGLDWLLRRHRVLAEKRSRAMRDLNYGNHLAKKEDELRQDFQKLLASRVQVINDTSTHNSCPPSQSTDFVTARELEPDVK